MYLMCAGVLSLFLLSALGSAADVSGGDPGRFTYSLRLKVTSDLPFPRVPMDPVIDFGRLIKEAGLPGVLDPGSVIVVDVKTGESVPHALHEDFAYGDKGRVEWVIAHPTHREYEIRFRTAKQRPLLGQAKNTPLIGVGDLLRHNAGQGRPFAPTANLSGLVDMNGDGKRDIVGVWSYAHRPGSQWNAMVVWPRVGDVDKFKFGDMMRLRDLPNEYYSGAYVLDVNKDDKPDVVYEKAFTGKAGRNRMSVYLNTGKRDRLSRLSTFKHDRNLPSQSIEWHSVRVVDLDNDGALDIVLADDGRYSPTPSTYFLKNTNAQGRPFSLADAVRINVQGYKATFFDVDKDGLPDSVSLFDKPDARGLSDYWLGWQRNRGGAPPTFGPAQNLPEINARIRRPGDILAIRDGKRQGLLITFDNQQRTAFFVRVPDKNARVCFERFAEAQCDSAVISAGDQAWPCVCDWDGDGDWDLLIGGGYGWPRILINNGSNEKPTFGEPQLILSEGEPIRLLMNEVFNCPEYKHNMGYPYPVYVDWDGDGLPDLMLPNITNRIFWHRNIGTRGRPEFGPRRQVICDGWPDSAEIRTEVGRRIVEKWEGIPDGTSPFNWRTGAGFGDWNGDGLMDIVSTYRAGKYMAAALFVQYRDAEGKLRLKKDRVLKTVSGATFCSARYVCVDWDGDGDLDIVASGPSAKRRDTIHLARNAGTNKEPVFEYGPLRFFGEMIYITRHGPCVDAADMDGDGKPDILACVEWSVYPFYSHAAVMMKERPVFTLKALERLR